jgi:hypothetical protein
MEARGHDHAQVDGDIRGSVVGTVDGAGQVLAKTGSTQRAGAPVAPALALRSWA